MTQLTLKSFQESTVQYGIKNPYCIYALEMGLGKTICAIETAVRTNSKALIFCPSYLKLNWKREIEKFYSDKVVTVFKSSKDFYRPFDSDFVVVSYSFIDKSEILFEWADIVICDEAHFLKDMKSKRTENFHRLVYENSIKRCLLLTGTPILNRVYEFYSLMAICNYNPKVIESPFLQKFPTYVEFASYFSYLREFEVMARNKRVTVRQWEGSRNIDDLWKYLEGIFIRFRAKDVLDLPDYRELIIPVDGLDCPELLEEFDKFASEVTSVQSTYKKQAAMAKTSITADYVKNLLDQELQVIVYSDHPEAAQEIAKKLGVTAITGETTMDWRNRYANQFREGSLQVLVASIGAFSTGENLQNAFHMVFNDYNWVPGTMDQARARTLRIGQKEKCTFHYLMGSEQDAIIFDRLNSKKDTIEKTIER